MFDLPRRPLYAAPQFSNTRSRHRTTHGTTQTGWSSRVVSFFHLIYVILDLKGSVAQSELATHSKEPNAHMPSSYHLLVVRGVFFKPRSQQQYLFMSRCTATASVLPAKRERLEKAKTENQVRVRALHHHNSEWQGSK